MSTLNVLESMDFAPIYTTSPCSRLEGSAMYGNALGRCSTTARIGRKSQPISGRFLATASDMVPLCHGVTPAAGERLVAAHMIRYGKGFSAGQPPMSRKGRSGKRILDGLP